MSMLEVFFRGVGWFYLIYLMVYASYLLVSVLFGAWQLYQKERRNQIRNELTHDYYMPISILVPAYNEEVTIVDNVKSLISLDYRLYEIVIVDDGSKDNTVKEVVEAFKMEKVNKPIYRKLKCKPVKAVYETIINNKKVTLISKENGGKADALNMGINVSTYPYFLGIDADSMLQKDSLEKIVQPLLEDNNMVAVGGLIHVAQCMVLKDDGTYSYRMPNNPVVAMQVVEYDRSFLASRILMDGFNGNLIISGAFGLFKKDVVVAAGGYDTDTMGEDMELVVKLHVFCKNNKRPYTIKYEPSACCWSQAPGSIRDLMKQRRRWHLGLFQSMTKYKDLFANPRFGMLSIFSYTYYLLYELLSPVIEIFGIVTMVVAWLMGILNFKFMIKFLLLYGVYGAVLTLTAFFQRIYTQNIKISILDIIKAIIMCLIESVFFRYLLSFVRMTSFIGYKKRKHQWGSIKRVKQGS